tara:strand:+ start:917 stop:2071 length:1155 start_codon:yes stop_codon:yes gene_type:complete
MALNLDKTLSDIGRRELDFTGNLVAEALPEYFRESNPKFIKLLEEYYKDLDADGNFGQQLKTLPTLRDISQTAKANLSFIEDELLLGQNYIEGILDNRTGAELSNNFYRSKGTKFGIERFFKMFFNETPEIIYGKDLVYKVGDKIGPETGLKITDPTIFQFWGILIKLGIAQNEWLELYKLFAHPGGMFVGSEIQITSINADLSFDLMPISVPEAAPDAQFVGLASAAPFAIQEITGLVGTTKKPYDSDGTTYAGSFRVDFARTTVGDFTDSAGHNPDVFLPYINIQDFGLVTASASITVDRGLVTAGAGTIADSDYGIFAQDVFGSIGYLDNTFKSVVDAVRINSQTMDEDSDASPFGLGTARSDNTKITIDADEFAYYTDSA